MTYRIPWAGTEREVVLPADAIRVEIAFTDLPPVPNPPVALERAYAIKGNGAAMATGFPGGIQWRIMPWREG